MMTAKTVRLIVGIALVLAGLLEFHIEVLKNRDREAARQEAICEAQAPEGVLPSAWCER